MRNEANKKLAVVISYCTMILQFAVVFFVTPFLLRQLGKAEYGLFQMISSTVSYLSLLGFGFSASYIRFFSRYKSQNNHEGIARLNGMFMLAFLLMSVACIILGLLISYNIDAVFGNAIDDNNHREAFIMVIILSINMALTFPKSIFVCNTTAHERFVFQKSVVLFIDIISPVLQIVLVLIMKNPVAVSIAILMSALVDFSINCVYNIKKLAMPFSFKSFDWNLMKEIGGFTFFIFLNQVLDLLSSTNIDNYLIGRICGTDSVTTYTMGGKISQMFYSVAAPISAIFVPTIYRIVDSGEDSDKLTKIFTKVGKIQFAILYMAFMGFVLWGKIFYELWIGKGYDDSYYIAITLMASLIIALSQNIGIEIQRAVNKHRARSVVYLLIDIGNVLISIPLIIYMGPIGAAVGTAVAMLLGTGIFMNTYYKYAIGINIKHYWANTCKIIIYTIPCWAIAYFVIKYISFNSIAAYILQILIFVFTYGLIAYWFVFDKNERNDIFSLKKERKKGKCEF
ncbi:lipopolysaccharide biosynthesis protein [Pseudobutyrivibrio sp. MD2005]|uniref:lipopolysaccharide biosynthesis protein n=1 Tax=Pseudobutyrivibrio sp. MD2005 TaxID=1410616 RepID=UPI0004895E13|nr:oligosaccharide flippase family protein [Pseudobutyrivibrio sp. MD2005]